MRRSCRIVVALSVIFFLANIPPSSTTSENSHSLSPNSKPLTSLLHIILMVHIVLFLSVNKLTTGRTATQRKITIIGITFYHCRSHIFGLAEPATLQRPASASHKSLAVQGVDDRWRATATPLVRQPSLATAVPPETSESFKNRIVYEYRCRRHSPVTAVSRHRRRSQPKPVTVQQQRRSLG
ncbi:hypothetical protein ACI65C_009761 [Semiaphis heraclei]